MIINTNNKVFTNIKNDFSLTLWWWIAFLIIFVLPHTRSLWNKTTAPDNSKVVIRDNANVLSDTSLFSSKGFDGAIIVIESFDSIPLDSANQFITKHFEDLSLVHGDSFRDFGILVIGSKKENIAASWMGEIYNNIKSSSKYYRKSTYFEQEVDPTTSVETKINHVLDMAIGACQNTTALKQFAENQIWDLLYDFTKPSSTRWYRFFVYPCQWLFAKIIVKIGSFAGVFFFIFFYFMYLLPGLISILQKIFSKTLTTEKLYYFDSTAIRTIRFVFYYIPLTLGLIPIATFVSTSGVEYFGMYPDFGFSIQLITQLFNSKYASISIVASMISSMMFIASNSPSINSYKIEIWYVTVTLINGTICAVFFFLPLGLNIVFWMLNLPTFLSALCKRESIVVDGEAQSVPIFVSIIKKLFWSLIFTVALYLGLIRNL